MQIPHSIPPPHFTSDPSSSVPQVVVQTGTAPAQINSQGETCDSLPNPEAPEPISQQELTHIVASNVGNVQVSPTLIPSQRIQDQERDGQTEQIAISPSPRPTTPHSSHLDRLLETPETSNFDKLVQAAPSAKLLEFDSKENIFFPVSGKLKRQRLQDGDDLSNSSLHRCPLIPQSCIDSLISPGGLRSTHLNSSPLQASSVGPLFDRTPPATVRGFDLNKRPHELSIDRNEVEVIVIEDSESPTTHTLPHRVALQGLINNPGRDMWIYKMILVSRIHKIPLFSDWVVFPPYINANLTGSEVIDQFKKNSPMNAKVMAALMALYMELDAQLYFNGASTLRRLFLPPAWADDCMTVISADEMIAKWASFFAPPYLYSNFSTYNLVIAPLLIGEQWLCFAFDMDTKHVSIFHPGRPLAAQRSFVGQWYFQVQKMLIGLSLPYGQHFQSRASPLVKWKIDYYRWNGRITGKWFHGFLVAVFALYLDGVAAETPDPSMNPEYSVKWTLCRLLLDRPMNPLRPEGWFGSSP
ncbi:hypothetical protein BDA96_06G047400 [Sorghum bicolor]|uniref:Uncharacterized protein n=2 Tax=Sorghum bicolor TaxID=4558 RepID=A0A921QR50_SORBI|nr:hypothetical protein BDA96_06G047400 [Sorghum bicolor]OQU81333.1 hypothetical protein SORBI_3006G043101 [Sorghum bicolor]